MMYEIEGALRINYYSILFSTYSKIMLMKSQTNVFKDFELTLKI